MVKLLVEKFGAKMDEKCDYGETAFQHVNGRSGEGIAEVTAYLKMKTAMNAVMAANRFKAKLGNKATAGSDAVS